VTGRALAVLLLLATAAPAAAAPPANADLGRLGEAQARLMAGDWSEAARVAGPLAHDGTLARPDRAEAWRVYGLSLFFLGLPDEAEAALFAYLKLEPDAHLDPALVAPEAIVFFEDVRARHAGELRQLKPRPKPNRWAVLLNLIPPAGQFSNGDPAKGWALAATETVLLAANLTTYALLASRCHADETCGDDVDGARTLRTINLVSGALFAGVWVYGMIDGFAGYRRRSRAYEPAFAVVPVVTDGGAALVLAWGL
jgi:hypothetical protein